MLVDEGFKVVSVDASDQMLKHALKARWEKRKDPKYDEWGKLSLIMNGLAHEFFKLKTLGYTSEKHGSTGKITKYFFPRVEQAYRVLRNIDVTYQVAQTLTSHGGFAQYLFSFKLRDSPHCACDPAKTRRAARSRGLQYDPSGACGIGGGDKRPGFGAALPEIQWNTSKRKKNVSFCGMVVERFIEEANWKTLYRNVQHFQPGVQFDAMLCLGNSFAQLIDEFGDQREQLEALRNFALCLKPGGLLIIDHRNYDSIIDSGATPNKSLYYNVRLKRCPK
ncbi:Glycine N-methyltransferase [Eumeta japonica]|uniref:Glycine N-methyltransferase n=1 Tax=Eumeta variegata TaxID=151549 RepID=A0A4C1SM52_EUMVA|nr:Glycine N-methyltransferase [Eumeta japonica]